MTTPDRVQLVADVIAAHRDAVTINIETSIHCICGEWSMPYDHLGISEIAEEHRLHRARAILTALDGLLADSVSSEERL